MSRLEDQLTEVIALLESLDNPQILALGYTDELKGLIPPIHKDLADCKRRITAFKNRSGAQPTWVRLIPVLKPALQGARS